jgi:peptidoglycan/LPS O-acetylase OafA/YrhL
MATCLSSRHLAGFDSLRLLAAVSVMFSHSYLIGTGSEETEPFVRLLGPKNIIGLYGVFTFFIISGFLLARSLERNPCAITYAVNRSLRILPGFLLCTLATVLVIGPAFSTHGLAGYFTHPGTFAFLRDSINSLGDMPLPGVFSYNEEWLATTVNGSLWSLRSEALSYVFLLAVWFVLRPAAMATAVIVAISATTLVSSAAYDLIPGISYTLPYFAGGVLMNWVHRRFGTHRQGALFSACALVVSACFGHQAVAFALFGAYLVVFAGERPNFATRIIDKFGDCSYGVYLYGWPVQQMVRQTTGVTDPLMLFAISVPLALLPAMASFHLVEKPAMNLKRHAGVGAKLLVHRILSVLVPGRRAAVMTAKAVFVMGSVLVLTSRQQSYDFMESMVIVLGATVVCAMAAGWGFMFLSRVWFQRVR